MEKASKIVKYYIENNCGGLMEVYINRKRRSFKHSPSLFTLPQHTLVPVFVVTNISFSVK